MLKRSALLLIGLAGVNALGQHRCLYTSDSATSSHHTDQVVFDPSSLVRGDEDFTIASSHPSFKPSEHPILTSSKDNIAVHLAAAAFIEDIRRVTGVKLDIYNDTLPAGVKQAIIVGTSESDLIGSLEGYQEIRDELKGKWESFDVRVLEKPFKGLESAAVISGSDRVSSFTSSDVQHVANLVARYRFRSLRALRTSRRIAMALVVRFPTGQSLDYQIRYLDALLPRRALCQISRLIHQ